MRSLPILLLISLSAIAPAECMDCNAALYGTIDATVIESPHPYPAGSAAGEVVWSAVVGRPGATEILLRIERFDLAPGDRLEITTAATAVPRVFTADTPPSAAFRVPGDSAVLELIAVSALERQAAPYGIRIPYVAFREPATIPLGQPTTLRLRDATCLKAGHPCADPAWYDSARATARIWITRRNGTVAQCTGTMLDCEGRRDVLITARHCLAGVAEVLAEFGAEYAPDCALGTSECLSPETNACEGGYHVSRAVHLDPACDWGLVALDADPGVAWGAAAMAQRDAPVGTDIYVVQHPGGHCKEWDTGYVTQQIAGDCTLEYMGAQTGGGASGSAVRRADDNSIVGIHVGTNRGIRPGAIRPTLARNVLAVAYAGRPPPGVNVAPLSARVQTSSVYGPGWDGWDAVDGVVSLESKWAGADAAPPQWLALDLGEEHDVTGFALFAPSAADEPSEFNPKAFSFQSAPSWNGPWTDEFLLGIHLHREDVTYRAFPGTTKRLRYVRLHLTEANHVDRIARVPEFEVYAVHPAARAGTLELSAPPDEHSDASG